MSLQVTGGILRSRRLQSPPDRDTRPTAARIREALFSRLGQDLSGQSVLDLFAGAGTLGVEAGSRGAGPVLFVERSPAQAAIVLRNAALLDGLCAWRLLKTDALGLRLPLGEAPFALVFVDPPYRQGLAARALERLGDGALLSDDARVVVEVEKRDELPLEAGCLVQEDRRSYGGTDIAIYVRRTE
jgi:16S rRNA (guanine966-N2)-methyltransferase